jgi:hypothetical protein
VILTFFENVKESNNAWVFVGSLMKPGGSLNFFEVARAGGSLNLIFFQIPRPGNSLILKIFKYLKLAVL